MVYIEHCRALYFKGITPGSDKRFGADEYKAMVKVAKEQFAAGKADQFSQFMMEGHYLIQLWTAHLILEFGDPSPKLRADCLKQIQKYAQGCLGPLSEQVMMEETQWLADH